MEKKDGKRTFTIKNKLIIIGVLFLVSLSAIELYSSYSGAKIKNALDQMTLRQEQLQSLRDIEVYFVEFGLAGMDAIVDKGSGEIGADLKEEMASISKFLGENLPLILELADTDEEKQLAKGMIAIYPQLENALMVDLPKAISSKAGETTFAELDDRIDGLHGKLDAPLMAFVESVKEENREAVAEMQHEISTATLSRRIFAAVMFAVIGGMLFFIGRGILIPIVAACKVIEVVSGGDLTKRLTVGGDEIGDLATWFNSFIDKLHTIFSQIQSNTTTLNSSVSDLSSLSESLSAGSDDTTNRANAVATAAEQMSSNMNAVAAASEQASVNVNMVASASEEMNATVNEIAQNTANARQITEEAVTKTDIASQRVNELGGAAKEISKVTEVITDISEQTNLLALNATIEAARAGEAGKGFAVVANEIKELARQTAAATLEIKQKIDSIQSSTELTVTEISETNTVINDINDIVATIATAVEEQSVSTNEIATNVAQAAQGITEVNENVSQSSTVSGEISQEIIGVSQVAQQLNDSSGKVNSQSVELSSLAGQLTTIVNQFKL